MNSPQRASRARTFLESEDGLWRTWRWISRRPRDPGFSRWSDYSFRFLMQEIAVAVQYKVKVMEAMEAMGRRVERPEDIREALE
jgi:hypothetical protein